MKLGDPCSCGCEGNDSPKAKPDIDYGIDTRVKPMRIRYMELPMEHDGDQTRTPFIIVVDRVDGASPLPFDTAELQSETGALGVVVFNAEVQIGDDY